MQTWNDAVSKWRRDRYWRAAETQRREQSLLNWINPRFTGRALDTIRRVDLESLRDAKRAEGASPRTCNYLCQVATAILRAAVRWEWIDRAPAIERIPEGPGRELFLTEHQARRLLSELPEHLRRLAAFSLETGLRQGNARLLEWKHVQLDQNRLMLPGEMVKNRSPLLVPLTPLARAIIEACRGGHPRYVFVYITGAPMLQPRNSAWYAALRRCGLAGVRWHDLRHTWASWHMHAGTDALTLQKLGGWKTWTMVARYTHLDDAAAQAAVRRFARRRMSRRAATA